LLNDTGLDVHYFRIPIRDLALPSNAVTKVTTVRLFRENALADLAATYFKRLAENHQRIAGPNVDSVGQPSIELLRAVIATQLNEPQLAREPLESTLYLRIMEYVRAHLAEHDLTAAEIARRHNISVRELYTILSRSGITLGEWLRAHRLEECRKDLARPGARWVSITYVAHRWGFVNATHFSRVFRETYGMSPRDWRELNRRNQTF
jgi:AraC-like DNA-binding protein